MKKLLLSMAVLLALPATANASGFTDLGQDIASNGETIVDVHGLFRTRLEWLNNLDLDRGLDPTGAPLYPVPLGDPNAQTLRHMDMRLRTDLALYAPVGDVAVKVRADILDNLALGSTPDGPPQTTLSQEPAQLINIERVYGEALTPVGLLSIGRMGSDWGLGMFTNGGDCADCDSGDAADRLAFVTPLAGHVWAAAYDIAFRGPMTERPSGQRTIDLDPSDDVQGFTFAVMRYSTENEIARRSKAGKLTLNYGAYVAHRWQDYDVPMSYYPTSNPVPLDSKQVMNRGLTATAADLWIRLNLPNGRIEAEAAYMTGTIEQSSLIPGVILPGALESTQWGGALQSEFEIPSIRLRFGLDAGIASGDAAPGFGAFPGPYDDPAVEGQRDGLQANIPYDNEVNNFRFHPDFRVDRILFREIIGTVTDAYYVRPHLTWHLGELGPGHFEAGVWGVASWAMEASSTPNGESALGIEIDPTLVYEAYDTFHVALEYAAFFPMAAFDNPDAGLTAKEAQFLRLRIGMGF